MLSLLFYTISNALILLWAALLCFHKPSKSKNLVFVLLAFSQLFLISAFRYDIGFDYQMYAIGFRNMTETGFGTLTYKDWETGFILFTKVLGLIPGMDYQWYMIVLSFIAILPAAIFIYKNSEVPWISTVLYVNIFMFFMTMNFLRQMIAVSIVMLAWYFMKKNKFFIFALLIIFASFFHQTVLVMLPVYFLVKMKPCVRELLIYGFILLWFYTASSNVFDLITSFFHEEYRDSVFIQQGVSFVYAIFPVFITIAAFVLIKTETINLTNENKYLTNLTFIGTLMMVTMSKHSIIERLSYYFIIFMILLVPVIYQSLKTKGIKYTTSGEKTIDLTSAKSRKVVSMVFLLLVLALSNLHFYYGLFDHAHGAYEYVTWLKF